MQGFLKQQIPYFKNEKKSDKIQEFATNVHFLFTFVIQKRRENSKKGKSCLPRFVKRFYMYFDLTPTPVPMALQ